MARTALPIGGAYPQPKKVAPLVAPNGGMGQPDAGTPGAVPETGAVENPAPTSNPYLRGVGSWRATTADPYAKNKVAPMAPGADPRLTGSWRGPAFSPGPGAVKPPAAAPANPYGTESGPTYLEQRYLDRANGEDAAYNYALKRGGDAIDTRMAAGGSFNSGARGQQLSDFGAHALADSQGALDALAGGATGARQNKTDSMFRNAISLAGGEAGTVSPYALGAAGAMSAADQAQIMMLLQRSGIDGQAMQGALSALLNIGKTAASAYGGKPA